MSCRLQRFTADFRDLTSWVTEMKALINADELANDVAGAEALLDRHQEHKVDYLRPLQLQLLVKWLQNEMPRVSPRVRLMHTRTALDQPMKLAKPYSVQGTMLLMRSRKR